MRTLYSPIRVPPPGVLGLGKFTGHFWSDTSAFEPSARDAAKPAWSKASGKGLRGQRRAV